MRKILFSGLLLITSTFYVSAQTVPIQDESTKVTKTSTEATVATTVLPKPDPTPDKTRRVSSGNTANGYVRPDAKKRFHSYLNGMFGPMTVGKSVAYAGIGTWQNSPEEWGDHWDGFGRRVASGLGTNVIKQTITYGLGEDVKL